MNEYMTRSPGTHSELAVVPKKERVREVRNLYDETPDFSQWRCDNKQTHFWKAVTKYNRQHLKPKEVYDIPQYDDVLVLGAGPSLTQELADGIDYDGYDAIVVTIPMLEHYDELLGRDNVFVADAELEGFVFGLFYDDGRDERVQLVCPSDKYFPHGCNFKDLFMYDKLNHKPDVREEYPRSGGALALHVAVVCMAADNVDAYGFDLSGQYNKFINETMKYMNLPHVNRMGDLPLYASPEKDGDE